MKELKPRIHENGIDYILVGDYYVPDWKLPEEKRPVGHWGRLHQAYLRMYRPGFLQRTRSLLQAAHLPCRSERAGNGKMPPYH